MRSGVAGEHVLPGNLSLFNLRDAALGDAHPLGDLLLGQPSGTAHLGQAVPDDGGEQFLLARLDGLLAAGPLDLGGADVAPPYVAACQRPV